MSIKDAYKRSQGMGRNPAGLEVGTVTHRVWKRGRHLMEGTCQIVHAKVRGGSQAHKCQVAWPGLKSLKPNGECRWHCDCSDFLFTFYTHLNDTETALIGIELTESKGTGPKRAIEEAGLCKHLMALVDRLREDGLISR